jgi:hypothetical protein
MLAVAAIRPDQFVSVDITNEPDACDSIVNGGGFPKGATVLQLNVALPAGQTGLPPPGSYPINTTGTAAYGANAEFVVFAPGSCLGTMAPANASSGTIVISAVSATQVSGTFDVTFGENADGGLLLEHVTGQFDAPGCPLRSPGPDATKCSGFSTQ